MLLVDGGYDWWFWCISVMFLRMYTAQLKTKCPTAVEERTENADATVYTY